MEIVQKPINTRHARSIFRERFGIEDVKGGYVLIARVIEGMGVLCLIKKKEDAGKAGLTWTGLQALITYDGWIICNNKVVGRWMQRM